MSIEQHIEELRSELKGCMDRSEAQRIMRELDAALAQKRLLDADFDAALRGLT